MTGQHLGMTARRDSIDPPFPFSCRMPVSPRVRGAGLLSHPRSRPSIPPLAPRPSPLAPCRAKGFHGAVLCGFRGEGKARGGMARNERKIYLDSPQGCPLRDLPCKLMRSPRHVYRESRDPLSKRARIRKFGRVPFLIRA